MVDWITGQQEEQTQSKALMNMAAASQAADGMALDANDMQNLRHIEQEDWGLEPEGAPADYETAFDVEISKLSELEKKQRAQFLWHKMFIKANAASVV